MPVTRTVLLLLAGLLHAQAFTWAPCDTDKVPFIPDNVALVPDPPVIGSQVTFNIKGSNSGRRMHHAGLPAAMTIALPGASN
jgi:hypothetical protein